MKKSKREWNLILDELKTYDGTVEEFSKLKGVSRSSLYKHRKEMSIKSKKNKPEITFTKIDIKEETKENFYEVNKNPIVKIKIGKTKIILDSKDKSTLSFIMKELNLRC
jgi:hypothetical protein